MPEKRDQSQALPPGSPGGHTLSESSREVCPSFTSDDLACITDYLSSKIGKEACKKLKRAEMLPHLFKLRGEPMTLKNHIQFDCMYPQQYAQDTIVLSGRQCGKCCRLFDKSCSYSMRHPDGHRASAPEELTEVVSAAGQFAKTCPVTLHMRPGKKRLLRVCTRLGSELFVSPEHRFLQFGGAYVEASQLTVGSAVCRMRTCYRFGENRDVGYKARILGYLLGDGHCGNRIAGDHVYGVAMTVANKEVLKDFSGIAYPDITSIAHNETNGKAVTVRISSDSDISRQLVSDGLACRHSWDKFIPDWVFALDRDGTTGFVEAIWSTDGTVMQDSRGNAVIEYSTTSRLLATDLAAILSKYGILTRLRVRATGYRKPDGTRVKCRDCYVLRVVGYSSISTFLSAFNVPGKPSFELKESASGKKDCSNRDTFTMACNDLIVALFDGVGRHVTDSLYIDGYRFRLLYPPSRMTVANYLKIAERHGLQDKPEYRELSDLLNGDIVYDAVESVEDAGEFDTFDLTVDETHNYVLDGIVVHNSLNLSRSEVLEAISSWHLQLLYVAPLQSQAQRYSTLYLREAIKSCELASLNQMKALEGLWTDSKILTAVGHQSFANGAGIQLTYAKTSPDRARGIFADIIDFDEVQDQLTDNIPIISQSLKQSKWGMRRFTGTAKTSDNTIEGLWQNSSKCEWAMHCEHCNAWNIPNMDGRVLDMIGADGLHCVECGGKLNVRIGQWVPACPEKMSTFRGYHIPQIILPFHAENMNNWGKIVRDVLSLPLPVIMQEILGISCSQGQRLIDQAIIDRQSDLPSEAELQKELHRYSFIVGGLDWGGAEIVSFTVLTMVGVCMDGSMEVIWAKRYQGFDPDEILPDVARTVRYYGAKALFADYGLGFDKNVLLTSQFGLPVIQIHLCRQNSLLQYSPALGHPRWMVDKTTALDLLFLSIKYGKIRFPAGDLFKVFTKDLLSPYEEVIDHGDLASRRYRRDPARPDDFAMALCFATVGAMKMKHSDITKMIPNGVLKTDRNAPEASYMDPEEILRALNS